MKCYLRVYAQGRVSALTQSKHSDPAICVDGA